MIACEFLSYGYLFPYYAGWKCRSNWNTDLDIPIFLIECKFLWWCLSASPSFMNHNALTVQGRHRQTSYHSSLARMPVRYCFKTIQKCSKYIYVEIYIQTCENLFTSLFTIRNKIGIAPNYLHTCEDQFFGFATFRVTSKPDVWKENIWYYATTEYRGSTLAT